MRHEVLIYIPGVRWSDMEGTDRRLATALARLMPVLWVDPPVPPILKEGPQPLGGGLGLDQVGDGIVRLRAPGPPGFTRRLIRPVANLMLYTRLRQSVARCGLKPLATILSTPRATFPGGLGGIRVYYVTDDWISGTQMLGLDHEAVRRISESNSTQADLIAAVTPNLLDKTLSGRSTPSLVLPNGCYPLAPELVQKCGAVAKGAILIGQLNERIDVEFVAAVAERDVQITIIGPRTEREARARQGLDVLLSHPAVRWLGQMPSAELHEHLSTASVGLTPYVDDVFNRSSFPLKTMEYLGAGLPVVSTSLPAVDYLGCAEVHPASTAGEFASEVQRILSSPAENDPMRRMERINFAMGHSWEARASTLLDRIERAVAGRAARE